MVSWTQSTIAMGLKVTHQSTAIAAVGLKVTLDSRQAHQSCELFRVADCIIIAVEIGWKDMRMRDALLVRLYRGYCVFVLYYRLLFPNQSGKFSSGETVGREFDVALLCRASQANIYGIKLACHQAK
jgi:hypothetical protein